MKYYIISGEASGDLHGSNLIKEIFELDNNAVVRAWGGEKMEKAGAEIVKNYSELSFMGFYEVLLNLNTILKNISVILPFEKKYFEQKHNFKVKYLGHPIMDSIENFKKKNTGKCFFKINKIDDKKKIIAILPGSRKQEIKKILNTMLDVVEFFPEHQFVIAGAPNIEKSFYSVLVKYSDVKVVENQTYDLLSNSEAALVTSGTATLETALFNIPQVDCYKTSYISYFLAKIFIKIKFISLVNLIVNKEIIRELIQNECCKSNIISELRRILNKENSNSMKKKYGKLISLIGTSGTSKRIAIDIIKNDK